MADITGDAKYYLRNEAFWEASSSAVEKAALFLS